MSSQAQDVPGGVEITTDRQPTARTPEDPLPERHPLPVAAHVAVLRGVRRIDRDDLTPGTRSLVRQERRELRPRRVVDALRQTAVVHHPVDRQVLDRDDLGGAEAQEPQTVEMRWIGDEVYMRIDPAQENAFTGFVGTWSGKTWVKWPIPEVPDECAASEPRERAARTERGIGVPASEREGGSAGAEPPGLILMLRYETTSPWSCSTRCPDGARP